MNKKLTGLPFIALIFVLLTLSFTIAISIVFKFVLKFDEKSLKTATSYIGKIYSIDFPPNWKFEGPSEGPITGFPEFSKLVSPSGDTQIFIGLRGDNRFEFSSDDLQTNTVPLSVEINGKKYFAEENLLDLNKDGEADIATVEVELNDANFIGYREFSQEIFLPIKIQILYGFGSQKVPFEEKLKTYEIEKEAALNVLKTFKLKQR